MKITNELYIMTLYVSRHREVECGTMGFNGLRFYMNKRFKRQEVVLMLLVVCDNPIGFH